MPPDGPQPRRHGPRPPDPPFPPDPFLASPHPRAPRPPRRGPAGPQLERHAYSPPAGHGAQAGALAQGARRAGTGHVRAHPVAMQAGACTHAYTLYWQWRDTALHNSPPAGAADTGVAYGAGGISGRFCFVLMLCTVVAALNEGREGRRAGRRSYRFGLRLHGGRGL